MDDDFYIGNKIDEVDFFHSEVNAAKNVENPEMSSTDKNVGTLSSMSADENIIPWNYTRNSEAARETLNKIYNRVPENDGLKKFLTENCLHLLEQQDGNTGISVDIFEHNTILNSDHIKLTKSFSIGLTDGMEGRSGVYMFYQPETQDMYIGSAIDFEGRLRSHYLDFNREKPERLLHIAISKNGADSFIWIPIEEYPNYFTNFSDGDYSSNVHPSQVHKILTFFNQYQIRLIEQSILSCADVDATINSTKDVIFNVK